nr:hypothetical protein [Tanacetum cinerariifolium]
MPEHQSDIFVIFTVTMEILLEPTLNKLLVGGVGDSIWIELVTLDINLEFEMSDMGELTFFLGLQVKQLPNGIFISQDKSMIGSLIYLTASRPDIMFVVSACSRNQLEAYSDSDYAGSHGDRKSTTGGCQFLGKRLISWQCKKQTVVATSSTEAEYVAAASCCSQASNATGSTSVPAGGTGSCEPSDIIATIAGNEVVVTEMREIRTYNFSRFILDGMIGNIGSKRHKFLMYPRFLQMILGIQTTDPSPRPTFNFMTKLFSNMKLNWDGPHMPLLAPMLVFPASGDGADAAAASEVSPPPSPPDVPPTHTSCSTPGPSLAAQDTPMREPTPVREPTPSLMREPTIFREPTPDSPRPPSPLPYPKSEEVGLTTSTRPPSPSRQTSFQEDISEGGGDYVSSPKSDEAPPTTTATAAGGAEDFATLTDLSLKLDSPEVGFQGKEVRGAATAKKEETVLSDYEENISANEDTIPADAQTIPAGSTPIPSSGATDEGKAPMVDDSLPTDLLTEQERILKNLHDYQLGVDLAKKLYAKHEAEFARQQEELAHKAQAESVASPAEQGTGLLAQCRRELDAAQLIYTEADWLELMAKIATNTTLSKKLLGDDVNEDNMNERLGMLLMRKRRELAEQSRVKPMNKTQQRDFMKNQSASMYNQGWTMKQADATLEAPSAKRARQEVPHDVHVASLQVSTSVPAAPSTAATVSVPAAPSTAAAVSVPTTPPTAAAVSIPAADVLVSVVLSVHADIAVDADESRLDATQTATEHVSTEHTIAESTPSSLHTRRKQIAKKREMVPSPLGSIHAYYDMEGHTKHFTSLRELLHMVEKNDLRKLLGAVDNLYQREEHDTFSLILWGDLCVLFQSLADEDAHAFWRNPDSWRIRSWRLYPPTLKRMLKHGLEVPKLLVGRDLTMAEQLLFVLVFHHTINGFSSPWFTAKKELTHHEELASPEQTATGKDVSNPFMAVVVCQKPLGYFSSPMIHVPKAGLVINPLGYVVPAGRLRSHSCCWVSAGKHSFCCQ